MKFFVVLLACTPVFLFSCTQREEKAPAPERPPVKTIERQKPKETTYHYDNAKRWLDSNRANANALRIVMAVNRVDSANFAKMDSVVIPGDLTGDVAYYLPFPLSVPALRDVNKIVFFSYPTQVFAAYENGELMYTGPTSMGRKKDTTPNGLFFTNWKAEQTTSTFNDEWDLRWNFNILNTEGIGWHQYALPGYPASHSCLRMLEKDARYMYDWADMWVLQGQDSVKVKGTPVIVFGHYNFDAPAPSRQLVGNPKALDIPASEIEALTAPHMNTILAEQKNRAAQGAKP